MKPNPFPLCLSLLAGCASLDSGPAPRGTVPMTNEDVLVLYSAGCEGLPTDPRDAHLRAALELLDERLRELANEVGEDFPLPIVELACDLLRAPASLRLDLDESGDWTEGPPLAAQLTVRGTGAEIDSFQRRVRVLLETWLPGPREPVEGNPGLERMQTEAGRAFVGRQGDAFVASLGEPVTSALGLGSMDLPRGVEPAFALKLDTAKLRGPIEMFLGFAGEDAALIRRQLRQFGILEEEPMAIHAAWGRGKDRTYVATRYVNYVQVMRAQGSLVLEPIPASDLALFPADATIAVATRYDPSSILGAMRNAQELEGPDAPDPIAVLRDLCGIDLGADLLDTLGATSGFYLSDTTGGGGLASAVLFVSVDDAERLKRTIQTAVNLAIGLTHEKTEGYATIREWSHGDAACWSTSFPGLPIPLECSAALTSSHFFLALTPQALVSAIDQASSNDGGLARNRAFRAAAGSLDDLAGFSFQDTSRLIDEGYGYATLLFSALANAVRSRTEERGPDLVLPPFHALKAGAVPSVVVTRFDGNDLLSTGEADPSLTANLTALLGTPVAHLVAALAIAAGAAVQEGRASPAELLDAGTFEYEVF